LVAEEVWLCLDHLSLQDLSLQDCTGIGQLTLVQPASGGDHSCDVVGVGGRATCGAPGGSGCATADHPEAASDCYDIVRLIAPVRHGSACRDHVGIIQKHARVRVKLCACSVPEHIHPADAREVGIT
jgi:hypothetical protein